MRPEALLQVAVAHYREGRLAEAAQLYRRVLEVEPDNVDALHLLGLATHRMGRPDEALRLMDRALAADPDYAPVLANRALALRSLGRDAEAEESLRRALTARPDFPEAEVQLARVRLTRGDPHGAAAIARSVVDRYPQRLDAVEALAAALLETSPAEAVTVLERGLAKAPQRSVLHADLAAAKAALGDDEGAIAALRRAVALEPGLAGAWRNLAALLHRTGRLDPAQAALDRALALDRDDPVAKRVLAGIRTSRAHAARREGRPDEALDWLRRAAEADPDVPAHDLGTALQERGEIEEALAWHRRAVAADPDRIAWIGLADVVARLVDPPDLPELAALLEVEGVDHQAVEHAVRARIPESLDHPLTDAWLRRTIVRHPDWERRLTAARREQLDAPRLERAISLALQAFHTEYAWWVEPDEAAEVAAREPRSPAEIAALASYGPVPGELLGDRVLEPLRVAMVDVPREEEALAAALPTIALSDDAVSAAVREQYEQNPYPRLVSQHRKPAAPLGELVRGLFPHADLSVPEGPIDVLVAGCGTGQQLLAAGTRYADARVVGIDLSRRSLGAALRRVRAWDLAHVEVAQADILALDGWDRRFDVIECGGVLHHLADPMAGWRVLVSLIRPGGLMKLGLYSERARAPVVAARAMGEERGWTADPDGLRRARREILDLPDDHLVRELVRSPDFYSLSGARDLFLHACEHRFTPTQLADALDALGLRLIGIQHANPRVPALYRERFPGDPAMADLARWDVIEREEPWIFGGMFQFWCQRP